MKKTPQLYFELMEESKSQRAVNVKNHKRSVQRVLSGQSRRKALNAPLSKVPLDFLAIGDSWFEYPLYNNGLPLQETGIVSPIQLGSMGNPPPQILNQALHGQATTAMLSWENQETLMGLLQDPSEWLNQNTGLPDAILVSAGGDNIVGDQFAIYLDYGGGGLNLARFQGVLDSIQASYMDLFAFRDIFARNVPIIGHCYDYAIPNGVTPICVETAWLKPSLDFAGYDYAQGLAIVANMIDGFYGMLHALAQNPANNFVLIDTRHTLVRDATSPTGWANEIHPYFAGFTALAGRFLAALRTEFPARI